MMLRTQRKHQAVPKIKVFLEQQNTTYIVEEPLYPDVQAVLVDRIINITGLDQL